MKDNCPTLMQTEERNAPWNESESTPVQTDCTVCYCMSKSMPVKVEHYSMEEGEPVFVDTCFIQEFVQDPCAFGIPTLLDELQKLCRDRIEKLRDEVHLTYYPGSKQKVREEIIHYQTILNASRSWVVDGLDVYKDE